MIVFLLAIIVLILLFGAAAVKGLVRGVLLYGVVGLLLVACLVILVNLVGQKNAHLVQIGGIASLLALWAFGKWAAGREARPLWQQKAERNRLERIAAGDDDTIGSALKRWERQREANEVSHKALQSNPKISSDVGFKPAVRLDKEARKRLRAQFKQDRQ